MKKRPPGARRAQIGSLSAIRLLELHLGGRHAKQFWLNDAQLGASELILRHNLTGHEAFMILDPITQEVIAFRIDPEISSA